MFTGRCSFSVTACATVFAIGVCCPSAAIADSFVQEIKNGTAAQTASDLNLVFTKPVDAMSVVRLTNTINQTDRVMVGETSTTTVRVSNANFPGVFLKPGELLTVRWEGASGSAIDKGQSRFTDQNRAEIVNSVASIGQPPALPFQGALGICGVYQPRTLRRDVQQRSAI